MRRGTPRIRILASDAAVHVVRNRMPFRYGKAVLTAAPILHVRVVVEAKDGRRASGLTADCLPPLWFDKDPAKDFRRNVEDQILAFHTAREAYLQAAQTPQAAGEIWAAAHPAAVAAGAAAGLNPLTSSFGSSFLERAMIDAVCRLEGLSFFQLLAKDFLGIDTAKLLPAEPLRAIRCRHTVGLGDPITVGEIPTAERLEDGLPQALEEDIEVYGLTHFKVKVAGDHERDLQRLTRIAALVHQRCRDGFHVTLDGNEQYHDPAALQRLLEAVRARPHGAEFFDSILYVEQPFPREIALDQAIAPAVARVSSMKPVIIDESDDSLDSFARAVELGYQGVSHKNCKGIFKSLRNRAHIARLARERKKAKLPPLFQTGEDLATVPILPLQQDLAVLAALDISHAERNGHHYFRGLDHLPPAEAAAALAAHRDLYEERAGAIFLKIQSGELAIGSLQAPGLGYSVEIAWDQRTPLASWSFDAIHAAAPP